MALPIKTQRSASQSLKALLGLRDLVYSGEVEPGERLTEISASEKLGLSRTPVRAALARLEREGLLEAIPSGGYAVRTFTAADVHDAIELRGVLEGTAARLAAERGVPHSAMVAFKGIVGRLDTIVGTAPSELDFSAYVSANAEFHDMLAVLSGSNVLQREIEHVLHLPFADPSAFLNAQPALPEFRASLITGQAQHRAIAHAIEMREGARAEAVAREHARLARLNLDVVIRDAALADRVPGLRLVSG